MVRNRNGGELETRKARMVSVVMSKFKPVALRSAQGPQAMAGRKKRSGYCRVDHGRLRTDVFGQRPGSAPWSCTLSTTTNKWLNLNPMERLYR